MFGLRAARRAPLASPWTCRQCLQKQRKPVFQQDRFYAASTRVGRRADRRRRVIQIGSALVAGTVLVSVSEYANFAFEAAQRSGRVVRVLFVNINEYRRILNKKEELSDDEYDAALKNCHKRCADRTLVAMEKNGSIFIKLGQHLTSMGYLLPSEWCDTFIPLQDQCPVTPFTEVKRMVEHDLGEEFESLFTEFEEEPSGAASLAQVHVAVDRQSGEKCAVKVQHPILDYWATLDLRLTRFTFNSLKRAFPEYDLTWLSDEMEASLPQELDFQLEGENAMRMREYFSKIPGSVLVVPKVLWAKRRIVVMEYVTGHRPDDLEYLDKNKISRDEVSATLSRIFNTMIFAKDAPLHCDPHGGNIAIRVNNNRRSPRNFDIILYDHGLYRTIPLETQRNYAKLWLAVLDADVEGMRKYTWELAGIGDDKFPLFASAITGRDYSVVAEDVTKSRSEEEKKNINDAMGEGLLEQLVQLLGEVPRILLLILKTNDLTRSLDTNLHTRQGPTRSFLILAQYAARTVFDEQVENLRKTGSLLWPPGNAVKLLFAWISLTRIRIKLNAYEWYLHSRSIVGLENPDPTGMGG